MRRLLLLSLLFLVACTSTYEVIQAERDSGFAGVDASVSELRFTVKGGKVTQMQGNGTPITAAELEKRLSAEIWSDPIPVGDWQCQWREVIPVEAGILCKEKKDIVFYRALKAKGNHQSVETVWRRAGVDVLEDESCDPDDGILCPLLVKAAETDPDICGKLDERQDYCTRMVAKA